MRSAGPELKDTRIIACRVILPENRGYFGEEFSNSIFVAHGIIFDISEFPSLAAKAPEGVKYVMPDLTPSYELSLN